MQALSIPSFNEKKATQLASLFISMHGERMNYTRLIKLMYLVERESLLRWGRLATFDNYFSLKKGPMGPILSKTLDLAKDLEPSNSAYWSNFIERKGNNVYLKQPREDGELSDAEEDLVQEIYFKYGHLELLEELINGVMHKLPEWSDPGNSREPITYKDILVAEGFSEVRIQKIEQQLQTLAFNQSLSEP